MIMYSGNKAYQSDSIIQTPNCTVINLTEITIQCNTYSNVFIQRGGIHLSYLSLSLYFTSLKLPPVFQLFHLFLSQIPLKCLFVAVKLQITATPPITPPPALSLLSLSSLVSSPEYKPALKSIGKYPSSFPLNVSLCLCMLVCFFCAHNSPSSVFLLYSEVGKVWIPYWTEYQVIARKTRMIT